MFKQLRAQLGQIDRAAWRRFVLGLFGLSLALFAALNATSLRQEGLMRLAWWMSAFALGLTGFVAVKIVPPMARRTIFSRWSMKVNYRLTREGIAYLGVVGVIVLAALNTGNNLLFMILASLLAGIVISGILSKIVLTDLELSFLLPEHVFAATPFVSRVSVKNCKRFLPSFSVKLSSRPEKKKKKAQAGSASEAQEGGPRRILNRTIYLPYVPRMARVGQELELNFPRRGRYTQDGFQVSTRFPFGFLEKSTEISLAQEVLVYPNVQPTDEFFDVLPLISGERESHQKGRGHDFYAIRAYTAGDSARHVDWKASAKLNRLQVREFTREDERRVVLVFDNRLPQSGPEDGPEVGGEQRAKFEKAVEFCACLAWHFFESNAQMQAVMDGWTSEMAPAGDVVYQALERLAVVEPAFTDDAGGEDFLTRLAGESDEFKIIFTAQPPGSVPTALWNSSYLIFLDSL